jgi:ubiquinol oxidase
MKDPVCGMTVDPETAAHHAQRAGVDYHFCSSGCRAAHRVVGYFEEEAVISYTHYLAEIDEGRSADVPAPEIAKRYCGLSEEATLRDVVLVVRADEAHHRDVNHGFANELAGLPFGAVAACPPHAELLPNWKKAA